MSYMSCLVLVWSTCNPRSTNFDSISGICMKLCRSKSRERTLSRYTVLQGDQSSSFGSSGERHDADERQGWRWSVNGQGILGIWWGGWQLGLVWRIFRFSVDNGYEEGRNVPAWFSMRAIVNCRYVRKYESMETPTVVPKDSAVPTLAKRLPQTVALPWLWSTQKLSGVSPCIAWHMYW